jgi:hypothetical protein
MSPMLFNQIRRKGQRRIPPLMRRGQAAQRGTTQLEFTSGQTANVHLPSLEFSSTKAADPLVIERTPAAERIAYTQDLQPIVKINMSDHV